MSPFVLGTMWANLNFKHINFSFNVFKSATFLCPFTGWQCHPDKSWQLPAGSYLTWNIFVDEWLQQQSWNLIFSTMEILRTLTTNLQLIKCSNFTFLTFMLELVCRWQQFGRNEAYLELLLLEQPAGIIWVISSTAASHLCLRWGKSNKKFGEKNSRCLQPLASCLWWRGPIWSLVPWKKVFTYPVQCHYSQSKSLQHEQCNSGQLTTSFHWYFLNHFQLIMWMHGDS